MIHLSSASRENAVRSPYTVMPNNQMQSDNGTNTIPYATMAANTASATHSLCETNPGLCANTSGTPAGMEGTLQTTLKKILSQNIGSHISAFFLIGTQHTVMVEGILVDIGTDYIVIHDVARDSYITGDFYALKFVEFSVENA